MRYVLVAGAAVVGLTGVVVVAPPAGAGGTGAAGQAPPVWKLVKVNTLPKDDVLNDVATLKNGSVWAAGHRVVNGKAKGVVERFDGKKWTLLPGVPAVDLTAIAASSPKSVWVFGQGKAARWNGKSWTTRSLGKRFSTADADALNVKDVWAVGAQTSSARHWNGKSWRSFALPGQASAIDIYKARDVWAAGLNGSQPAIMRWRGGSSWKPVPLPPVALPSPDAEVGFRDILVMGPKNVWAVGGISWEGANEEGDDVTFSRTLVMHWNGTKWTTSVGKIGGQPYTQVTPDGRGGVWIVQGAWNATLWHVTGSGWKSTPLPRKPGTDAVLSSIARIPGTATTWGAGFTVPQGDPDDPSANGAFWRAR
ncbi:hypothetical protein [Planotetraspora mira]|uniref:Uncharacterized protein n=1 Tax=Planotetraspora mira TaxID=58121 RepID=A0A8J3TTM8_9ACTN|nr:hypothetical protein [Planotetraspora mira]GII32785.1 hypothetical protein Pmi06nite_62270 [Planotetraspora mira]